jgi:hypothetical protein
MMGWLWGMWGGLRGGGGVVVLFFYFYFFIFGEGGFVENEAKLNDGLSVGGLGTSINL